MHWPWFDRRAVFVVVGLAWAAGCQMPGAVHQVNRQVEAAAATPSRPTAAGAASGELGSSIANAPVEIEREEEGFEWTDLEPENVWKNIKKATGFGPNEAYANSVYKEAEGLYAQKRFAEAAEKFKKAAAYWPDSVLEEDSMFFAAECYFFDDQYGKAHDAFMVLFKKHPNTRYLDIAAARQFAVGRFWERTHVAQPHWPVTPNFTDKTQPWFDTFGNAVNAYESVRLNDPTGPLADDSIMATANAYFVKGRYEDAAYYYDLLRKEYPKSEHQVQAHLLDLQAKRQCYQGPQYDQKPLDDAEEIARQALTQFNQQLGAERPRIAAARDEVKEQKAERDWAMGRFYEGKRQYGAARIYYRSMIEEHAGTQFAAMARQRLDEIKDKPDQPHNYFKWLTDSFDMLNKLP